MLHYPQRVKENILPLSFSQTLPEAFQEWYFNENTIDYGEPVEDCQLCNKEELRYHFEIKNDITNNTMMVGSRCILQFGVKVYENNVLLDEASSKRKLEKLIEKMRREACIKALSEISKKEQNSILENALKYYNKKGYLSPKLASIIAWKLKEYQIDHNPSFFKITLKKNQDKEDLKNLDTWKVHQMWSFLNSAQRKIAQKLGHSEPTFVTNNSMTNSLDPTKDRH
jgi:hypothetical protein